VFDSDSIDVIHRAKTISLCTKVLEILQVNYSQDENFVFDALKKVLKKYKLKMHSSFGEQDYTIKNLSEYVNRIQTKPIIDN
jgi:hypothetical protein